jgi:hypothetical protein
MRAARSSLILGLLLFGCTGSPAPQGVSSAVPVPKQSGTVTQSASPSLVPVSDIQFLLGDETPLQAGDRVPVKIKNVGDIAYKYQGFYQACFLPTSTPRDASSPFRPAPIATSSTRPSFNRGKPCGCSSGISTSASRTNGGCLKTKPLHSGTYSIRGAFRPVGGGPPARARITFEILPYF